MGHLWDVWNYRDNYLMHYNGSYNTWNYRIMPTKWLLLLLWWIHCLFSWLYLYMTVGLPLRAIIINSSPNGGWGKKRKNLKTPYCNRWKNRTPEKLTNRSFSVLLFNEGLNMNLTEALVNREGHANTNYHLFVYRVWIIKQSNFRKKFLNLSLLPLEYLPVSWKLANFCGPFAFLIIFWGGVRPNILT